MSDLNSLASGEVIDVLMSMKNSTILNYVLPGLNSSLIGGSASGKIRVFEALIEQEGSIVPHTHRYDFACLVLRGTVTNRIWQRSKNPAASSYMCAKMTNECLLQNALLQESQDIDGWEHSDLLYIESEWYSMKAEDFHSIYFSKGAMVLFFEGPERFNFSYVLQPFLNNQVIPTFKIEPWMFVKQGRFVDGAIPEKGMKK